MAGLDVDAFEDLYRSTRADVFAFVASIVRDRELAEEVTAIAFEKALRKRDRYDDTKGTPRGWMFGVARNAALDELRRGKRVSPSDELPEDASAGSREESDELRARRLTVRAAVDTLDERDQQLISLKFHADLSHGEMAQVLGVSESNAGTMLHRAMVRLRAACADAA